MSDPININNVGRYLDAILGIAGYLFIEFNTPEGLQFCAQMRQQLEQLRRNSESSIESFLDRFPPPLPEVEDEDGDIVVLFIDLLVNPPTPEWQLYRVLVVQHLEQHLRNLLTIIQTFLDGCPRLPQVRTPVGPGGDAPSNGYTQNTVDSVEDQHGLQTNENLSEENGNGNDLPRATPTSRFSLIICGHVVSWSNLSGLFSLNRNQVIFSGLAAVPPIEHPLIIETRQDKFGMDTQIVSMGSIVVTILARAGVDLQQFKCTVNSEGQLEISVPE